MKDEIIDDHSGGEVEIAVAEKSKATELNYLLSSSIDGKVSKFLSLYTGGIFKIPEFIRNGNEKAYEPQIIAIGPYHRGKSHLSSAEKHKWYFLAELLNRKGENSCYSYYSAMRKLEEKARTCYVDSVNLNSDEFVEMMLLDACFIIELVRNRFNYIANTPSWTMSSLSRDLLLVENQLPFFVLQEFYEKTKDSDDEELCDMIYKFFNSEVPIPICPRTQGLDSRRNEDSCKHLLGLLHMGWEYCEESERDSAKPRAFHSCINFIVKFLRLPRKKTVDNLPVVGEPLRPMNRNVQLSCNNWTSNILSSNFRLFHCCAKKGRILTEENWDFIRCATRLKELGIKFKKIKSNNLFHVKFGNGLMEIPTLEVYDGMEPLFRNFIAYEQFHRLWNVIDYVTLMDCLINTSEDVQLLRQCGIIENGLGDDEVLANMFNRLRDNVTFFSDKYMYCKIFREVNQYCNKRRNKWVARRNRWMVSLRHNYFSTPWALISFLAALLLLLFTVVQTVFSVLAYIKE